LWLMIFKRENRFTRPRQLIWFLLAGFTTAMVQIIGLDIVRYLLTGTWSGISLG
jgi:hypothetical protein